MLKMMAVALAMMLGAGGAPAAETAAEAQPRMVVQLGHTSQVSAVAVTPDGRFALTAGNSDILVWDLASGAQLRSFGAGAAVASMALSGDGRWLACGSLDGKVWLMDVANGTLARRFPGHTGWVHSLAFSPDGKILATGSSDGTLRLWNPATGENTRTLEADSLVYAVAISPDGRWLAQAGNNKTVRLWTLPDLIEQPPLKGHEGPVNTLAFAPDARRLASAGDDKTVRIWDLGEPAASRVFREATSEVTVVAFSPDGRTLAAAGAKWTDPDYAIRLYDLATGRVARELRGHRSALPCLAFAPDGKRLLTGHRTRVRIWDPSGKELGSLAGHASSVRAVKFSPDGRYLATAQNDATARIWELAQGSELRVFRGHEISVTGVAFSPDGAALATSSYDQTARLWDIASGACRATFQGHDGIVTDLAFSPDGSSLFTAGNDTALRRWKLPDGSARAFKGGGKRVSSLALSPDGRLAATTTDEDHTVRIWNTRSGAETMTLKRPKGVAANCTDAVAFTPDGRQVLAGYDDHNAYLWSLESGQVVQTFGLSSQVGAVAVSADGARVALGGWDGEVGVFERNTGRALVPVARQQGLVTAIAFSPDGARLATGGWDGAARLWEAATGRELVRMFSMDQGWVVITPEGAFDGSADGLKAIHWTVGLQSFPLDAFSEGYYVPAMLPRILAGETFASARNDISKGFKLPPVVRITAPAQGAALDSETVEVRVEATDQGGGVDEIRLYLNGKAVATEARGVQVVGKASRTAVFQVALVEGENHLQAVALNAARIESNPSDVTVRLQGAERQATLNVLAVGIDHYRNPALNLNFARADASAIADFFTSAPPGLFKRVEASPLFDADATKAAILARLEAFRALPPRDVAVIYLAGHGEVIGNTWYFLPYELVYPEREDEVMRMGLSSRELQDAIRAIGAQKVLVLLDACKSGEAMLAFAGRGVEDRKALAMLARAAGVHVVAASTKDQLATEIKELGHGVFTYTLLQGLRGAAGATGKVTVRGLVAYVESQLPEVSQKYKAQAQYPVVDSRGMDFPIAAGK